MATKTDELAEAVRATLTSPNEWDSNGEPANIVDAVAAAGRDIRAGLEALADAIRSQRAGEP